MRPPGCRRDTPVDRPFVNPHPVDNGVDERDPRGPAHTPPNAGAGKDGDRVPDDTMARVWRTTLEALDADGIPVQQRAFLSLARLVGLLDDTALLAVPNDFTKDVVETRLRDRVTAMLSDNLGREVRLAVTVDPSLGELPGATGGGSEGSAVDAGPPPVDGGWPGGSPFGAAG